RPCSVPSSSSPLSRPPPSPLFPYTTLFRSADRRLRATLRLCRLGLVAAVRRHRHHPLAVREGALHPHLRNEPWSGVGHRPDLERSEEHTSELQSRFDLVCRLLLEKKK